MSTTIVFACKSNSCRSQMAEGWARQWIAAQRRGLDEGAELAGGRTRDRRRLRAFLDGLLVASVALDEASVASGRQISIDAPPGTAAPDMSPEALSSSPTSSLTTQFAGQRAAAPAQPRATCVTCDGDQNGTCAFPPRRRPPKEKAIQAMARDGVDIAEYYAKTVGELLPAIAKNRRRHALRHREGRVSFAGLRRALEAASRDMGLALETASLELGLAFAGVARGGDEGRAPPRCVDALVVLCACPESLTRPVAVLAKETLEWDIAPPTAAARAEGDGAYLRVRRQIKGKVEAFLEDLKERAVVSGEERGEGEGCVGARGRGPATRAVPVPA